jgi:predicted MFS family arabinose efflux permease
LILLRYTQLEFFKKLFIVSLFIAMALDFTGIGYISGSEIIYGGFIENLNKLAALISFVALLTHAYLVFYIWGQSVKLFHKDAPIKTQTSS